MPFLQEYTMLCELGRGGFATIYKVRHNDLGYVRAIRVLNETIVNCQSKTYQNFLRECKVLLRLGNGNHPNIVHIYQPRLLDNRALVEMDYVDGMDIQHYLEQNQNFVSVEEVIRLAKQISSALAYCHEDIYRFCMNRDSDNIPDDPEDGTRVLVDDKKRKELINKYKVIHNDIHSGNIMRREDGNFILLDFGLAFNGDEVVRSSRHVHGAPEYKAPEKWDINASLSEQSDIYSFGIVLYQFLAGRVPFPYNTQKSNTEAEYELLGAHRSKTPPTIENIRSEYFQQKFENRPYERDYPQWLEDVIMKCLEKEPEKRFRNGKELYDFIVAHSQSSEETLRHEKEQLISENKKLIEDVENLKDQLKSKQDECDVLKRTLQKMEEDMQQLSDENNKLKKEIAVLLGQLEVAQKECDELKKKLQNLQKELDELRAQKPAHRIWYIAMLILFGIWGLVGSVFYVRETKKILPNAAEPLIADSLRQVIKDIEKQNILLQDALSDQKEEIFSLTSSETNQKAHIKTLLKDSLEKETKIAELNKQLDNKEKEIKTLRKNL